MHKRMLMGLTILVLFGGALWLLSPSRPKLIGNLPAQDIAEITDRVRREMGQQPKILPDLSRASIQKLPHAVSMRWSDRILSMDVAGDGTVEVRAGGVKGGTTYMLKKGPAGWEVISRRFWRSVSVTQPPNQGATAKPDSEFKRLLEPLKEASSSAIRRFVVVLDPCSFEKSVVNSPSRTPHSTLGSYPFFANFLLSAIKVAADLGTNATEHLGTAESRASVWSACRLLPLFRLVTQQSNRTQFRTIFANLKGGCACAGALPISWDI